MQQQAKAVCVPVAGSVVRIRSSNWKVIKTERKGTGTIVVCKGLSGIAKGKTARFVAELEELEVRHPAEIQLVEDTSAGYRDTKLFLASAFRATPVTTSEPMVLGKAAIDNLKFQHVPVRMALKQERVRLLIADDVGLGKTLEAGLITSELILRGRADRILVVATRAMMTQFQKEFWTRFSIPLTRLDSAAIRRMRDQIPAHYNVFDQFDRCIVSIDTLKQDNQIRAALEESHWDLVILDEAHNAARRTRSSGTQSLRSKLAALLSRRSDSLLLLTATPHDGSQESFASLIEMLDQTRVPDPDELRREDIDDLVVRRFRSTKEVAREIGKNVPERVLKGIHFPLSEAEEMAYEMVAELDLDADRDNKRAKAIDLFRTTLAKAIFSSPVACLETVGGRIRRIEQGRAAGTEKDRQNLQRLADLLGRIDAASFQKYQNLLKLLADLRWNGKDQRDRLVIFSERIRTLQWLHEHLQEDLGLAPEAIGLVHGSSVEADVATQKVLEDFEQERSPLRILLASDMASEGLNLHYQSHRLIHFDLPWSLLRFQQRNGRIDRYGQTKTPEIYYFVGESRHSRVRDMWVLEKLVEKDEAARQGVGDPAVFLGVGDADLEEEVVAEAVASGKGSEVFAREMDERAAKSLAHSFDEQDDYDLLFGDYTGVDHSDQVETGDTNPASIERPQVYPDTFTYAKAMLQRLADPELKVFKQPASINDEDRLIAFQLPDDMMSSGSFGYARGNEVDERYMPAEAVGQGNRIELTDRPDVIAQAVQEAKTLEWSWPRKQYLWDVHPILQWFADRAEVFFGENSAPLCSLKGRLKEGEVAVVIHGAIPNEVGDPVVDRWSVVCVENRRVTSIVAVNDFIRRVGLEGDLPNRGDADADLAQQALAPAVDAFQTYLVEERKQRDAEIEASVDETIARLARLEERAISRVDRKLLIDLPDDEERMTPVQRRQKRRRDQKVANLQQMFSDQADWFERHRRTVKDPNPWVSVKAVFVG